MKRRTLRKVVPWLALALALLMVGCGSCDDDERGQRRGRRPQARGPIAIESDSPYDMFELSGWRLCEANAALVAPWSRELVMVSDPNAQNRLSAFAVSDGRVRRRQGVRLPRGHRIKDIRAMAAVGQELLLVGSQSRDGQCNVRSDRERLRQLRLSNEQLVDTEYVNQSSSWREGLQGCLSEFFVTPPPPLASEVCEVLIAAEQRAESNDRCDDTLTVEGAATVAGTGPSPNQPATWLGLRTPLLRGHAILLRLAPRMQAFRFDAVALVDLGGAGVSELSATDDWLWGIGGPVGEEGVSASLWRVPRTGLNGGAELAAEVIKTDLPSRTSGLVVMENEAFATVPGRASGQRGCAEPSAYYFVPLGE